MDKVGIIYIGDRNVGKTHLALELANPRNQHVKVVSPNYDNLKSLLSNEEDSTKPTEFVDTRYLEIQARLPAGPKNVTIDWVDTPGEMWRDRWQKDNPEQWQAFLGNIRKSEGILLILDPHRGAVPSSISADYSNEQQWCKRFEKWVDFFKYDCPKARHIVLCLNKADLFVDNLDQETSKLSFHPNGSEMNWRKRHSYVLQKYFRPIQSQIEQINKNNSGLSVQCFITSIHSRPLLELPWLYLASFLAK
jgi:GTPase SAR1 family protein